MSAAGNAAFALPLDASPSSAQEREFAFSNADFQFLAKFAYDNAGIVLSEAKRNLVYSRVSRRLRVLGLTAFRDYNAVLIAEPAEIEHFINAISTNLTKMFREGHHFTHLRTHVVLPYARGGGANASRRLRIWSAGCSSGEEPYTLAAVLKRDIQKVEQRDVRILATDIDTEVLEKASQGEYPMATLDDVPSEYRQIIQAKQDSRSKTFRVEQDLNDLIRFKQLNLLSSWPFAGPFDAIFCRNVMIYFDGPTKANLINRFADKIVPGGWLYIGHSESILGTHPKFELVGRTVYRRRG